MVTNVGTIGLSPPTRTTWGEAIASGRAALAEVLPPRAAGHVRPRVGGGDGRHRALGGVDRAIQSDRQRFRGDDGGAELGASAGNGPIRPGFAVADHLWRADGHDRRAVIGPGGRRGRARAGRGQRLFRRQDGPDPATGFRCVDGVSIDHHGAGRGCDLRHRCAERDRCHHHSVDPPLRPRGPVFGACRSGRFPMSTRHVLWGSGTCGSFFATWFRT